mmetsp:Transcript_19556/g.74039  ORF Transcript_19556/g.74039 Transcript_19556/m.74039 type:complete len:269 (-) Transcript_19556:176-982(-)
MDSIQKHRLHRAEVGSCLDADRIYQHVLTGPQNENGIGGQSVSVRLTRDPAGNSVVIARRLYGQVRIDLLEVQAVVAILAELLHVLLHELVRHGVIHEAPAAQADALQHLLRRQAPGHLEGQDGLGQEHPPDLRRRAHRRHRAQEAQPFDGSRLHQRPGRGRLHELHEEKRPKTVPHQHDSVFTSFLRRKRDSAGQIRHVIGQRDLLLAAVVPLRRICAGRSPQIQRHRRVLPLGEEAEPVLRPTPRTVVAAVHENHSGPFRIGRRRA